MLSAHAYHSPEVTPTVPVDFTLSPGQARAQPSAPRGADKHSPGSAPGHTPEFGQFLPPTPARPVALRSQPTEPSRAPERPASPSSPFGTPAPRLSRPAFAPRPLTDTPSAPANAAALAKRFAPTASTSALYERSGAALANITDRQGPPSAATAAAEQAGAAEELPHEDEENDETSCKRSAATDGEGEGLVEMLASMFAPVAASAPPTTGPVPTVLAAGAPASPAGSPSEDEAPATAAAGPNHSALAPGAVATHPAALTPSTTAAASTAPVAAYAASATTAQAGEATTKTTASSLATAAIAPAPAATDASPANSAVTAAKAAPTAADTGTLPVALTPATPNAATSAAADPTALRPPAAQAQAAATENSAAVVTAPPTALGDASLAPATSSPPDFLTSTQQELSTAEEGSGIKAAKPNADMFSPVVGTLGSSATLLPSAVTASTALTSVAARAADPVISLPTQPEVGATHVVRHVMDLSEDLRSRPRSSVQVDFNFQDDTRLHVRLEYHQGALRAIFHTDSAELRDALSHAWQTQAATDPALRLTEPVFTAAPAPTSANSPQSPAGFSLGGDSSRDPSQSGQSGQSAGTGQPSPRSASSSAGRDDAASTSLSADLPNSLTVHHLQAFA